jgi:2-iminobutanoate/2-iminopropanoate deaminase
MKLPRNPSSVHAPLAAYTHQIEIRGGERLLVLSGQVGVAADGSIPDGAAEQLDMALQNVLRNLDAAAMSHDDLVKLTLFVTSTIDADTRRTVLARRLRGHQPCMTFVYVAALASPVLKVEIDAWASAADVSAGPPDGQSAVR